MCYDIHDGTLACDLSLSHSRLCPRGRPLTLIFTIVYSFAHSHIL